MYYSLEKYCEKPFVLWVLCFDDETYQVLSGLELANVRLIAMDEFEDAEPKLKIARSNRSPVEFFWTCTPLLPLYVFEQDTTVNVVTYLDADMWFMSDPQILLDELSDSSVLIVGHRYSARYVGREKETGIYNVSWVSFKRDKSALECVNWWKDKCLAKCKFTGEGASCGDQKYLDEWPERFKGIKELTHKGAGLAPWNLGKYNITNNGDKVTVDGEELIFYHFHGLKLVGKSFVKPMDLHYCEDCDQIIFRELYYVYAQELKHCYNKVKVMGTDLPLTEVDVPFAELIDGVILRAYFLGRFRYLSSLVWMYAGLRYKRMIIRQENIHK